MRAGKEHAVDPGSDDPGSDWSDAFEDSEFEEDSDEDDGTYTYYTWCMRRAADQRESHEAGPSCSSAAPGSLAPLYGVDEEAFASKCFEWHGTREQEKSLAEHFNLQLHQVKRLKRQLSLTFLGTNGVRPELPTCEELQEQWSCSEQPLSVQALADAYGVSIRTMRDHLRRIEFAPPGSVSDDEVIAALQQLVRRGWCSNIGRTFVESELRSLFGLIVPGKQIRRCLAQVDPEGRKQRAKEAAKAKYQYKVAGPRSLYHADAHEKLAKIWGMWIHVLVDGYSRYIIYLRVSTDKYARTVNNIFVDACNEYGWASRVRWDKGSENADAILSQIDKMGPNRGSALTGRSCQNCRAEYIWNFVKKHVTSYFRALFFRMQKEKVMDPNLPTDLFCLQAVFVPMVQDACNDFRRMWNSHRIRGQRTVDGHGGGIPEELFNDPIASATVLNDDAGYQQQGEAYGVEEPFRGDHDDASVAFEAGNVRDPLEWHPVLQQLREEYFKRALLDAASDGIDDFLRFRGVCTELLAAEEHFSLADGSIDWESYAQSLPTNTPRGELRYFLGWLAVNVEL